ncbi:hypothetical protein GCM10022218_12830 [Sphingobacterium ginsenosidimutans]|uniref:Uncharacterized protein n=1 Tax=Sphingobacterium ginsenosidimutans TaxID=687845 RepID=A0ABP7ZWD3_9SPHI
MLADFGFVGYKKRWEVGNFPIAEYITLKAARERMDLRHASCLEEDEYFEYSSKYECRDFSLGAC